MLDIYVLTEFLPRQPHALRRTLTLGVRFWLTVLAQYALPRFVPGDDTRRRVLPSLSLYVVPSANFLLGDIFLRLAGITQTPLNNFLEPHMGLVYCNQCLNN